MADLQDIDDDFWEHLNIKNNKRAESKEQQLKALLARIDELQSDKQQLQDEATAARAQTANLNSLLSSAKTQLHDARRQYQQEVDLLKQQLADAQQQLQQTQSSGSNNSVELEALRHQASADKDQMDQLRQQHSEATARFKQAEKEKQLLLTNLQNLLKLNAELQATLTAERQKTGAPAGARPAGQEPSTSTPPQSTARPAAAAGAAPGAGAAGSGPAPSPAQAALQPRQAHQPSPQQQQQYRPAQPFVTNKRKHTSAGAGTSRKKGKKVTFAEAAQAAAQEALARDAAAATAAAQRAAEELRKIQERQKQKTEQDKKAQEARAEAARKRQQAAKEAAAEKQRRQEEAQREAQRRAQEQLRQQQEAMRRAAEEAERQRHAAEEERLRQQAAAAEARKQQMEYNAQQPELDSMSAGELKDYLKQAGVDAAAMRGVLEKSDLLRVAKAHKQLWECRRICLCGELAQDEHMRLYSAVCVFRISHGAGQDLGSAVRAVKDGLKKTRMTLSLLVHPDKATNELARYKPVFEEAFKVLTNAHETLTAAADGKYEGSTAQPQAQQQQQGYGYAAGGPGFAGFPGGFPGGAWGFAGFPNGFNGFYYTAG